MQIAKAADKLDAVGSAIKDTALDLVPFYGTYRAFSSGHPIQGTISAIGDLTLIIGVGAELKAAAVGDDFVFHYTSARSGAAIERTGLWAQSSATNVGNLTAQEAVEMLGVKTPPEVVVQIKNAGQFIPNRPAIVQPHPLGPGGGLDLTNPSRVPADCIVCVFPVRKP